MMVAAFLLGVWFGAFSMAVIFVYAWWTGAINIRDKGGGEG